MAMSKAKYLENEADQIYGMLVPILGPMSRPNVGELKFDPFQPGQFFSQIAGGMLDQKFELAHIGKHNIGPVSELLYNFGVRKGLADAITDCASQINSPLVESRTNKALIETLKKVIFYENEEQIRGAFKKILQDSEEIYGHRRFPELLTFFFEETYATEYPSSLATRFPRTMVFMVLLAEFERFENTKEPNELVRDFVDRLVNDPFKVLKAGLEDYILLRESEIKEAGREARTLAR